MPSSFADLIHQGGIFMIPLLLGSVVALGVAFERIVYYLRLESGGQAFRDRLLERVRAGKRAEALEWLRGLRGPVPATAIAGLEKWEHGPEAVEAAMAARARREAPALQRYFAILETTVTAAPLVGLLGTITGMMGTFRVVAKKLAHDPSADTTGITAGIGEALIATATGIGVAVLALLVHSAFQSWADAQMDNVEAVAGDLLALRQEVLQSTPPRGGQGG